MNKLYIYIIVLISLFLIQCKDFSNKEITGSEKVVLKDSCCIKDSSVSNSSEITCPHCAYKKTEVMPTDVCLINYTCKKCNASLYPKDGDCCVFCSYGTHKCPSKQN